MKKRLKRGKEREDTRHPRTHQMGGQRGYVRDPWVGHSLARGRSVLDHLQKEGPLQVGAGLSLIDSPSHQWSTAKSDERLSQHRDHLWEMRATTRMLRRRSDRDIPEAMIIYLASLRDSESTVRDLIHGHMADLNLGISAEEDGICRLHYFDCDCD